jgi:hypothetical protein
VAVETSTKFKRVVADQEAAQDGELLAQEYQVKATTVAVALV